MQNLCKKQAFFAMQKHVCEIEENWHICGLATALLPKLSAFKICDEGWTFQNRSKTNKIFMNETSSRDNSSSDAVEMNCWIQRLLVGSFIAIRLR